MSFEQSATDSAQARDAGADAVRHDEMAAVDLGSNSFHLLVARVTDDGMLQVIDRLREPVRLAGGLDMDGRLSSNVRRAALECLGRFGQRIAHLPSSHVRVVGTNTLREMHYGVAFAEAAESVLGHGIEIISGAEEARLVYEGVTHGLGDDAARRLVVDIGGGSTELIIGDAQGPKLLESVALGCVAHTRRFFEDGVITRKRFQAARLAARVELEYLERPYLEAGWDLAIGSSGTIRGIWRVLVAKGWCEDEIHPEALEQLVELLIDTGKIPAIRFEGLREDRRPVFAGGLAALTGIFDSLGIRAMRTSDRALREGLIYDMCQRRGNDALRSESVLGMARRYGVDLAHARDVADTALEALRQVRDDWQLHGVQPAKLLEWAALLHEVGLAISHASYHKHGEYILRRSDIQGFSQTEQKLVSVLVRLHRGKLASSVFDGVPGGWELPLRRLAVLLRLAYLFNRSRRPGVVPPLHLRAQRSGLRLGLPEGWLGDHPLTHADLQREVGLLATARFKLVVG